MTIETDYLIIGAGVIGLTVARELLRQSPDAGIIIVEKEPDVAYHSSGRNSGVLHAGFYYTSDSLKAKFTRDGNKCMREYCYSNNLSINECKKVVIAQNEEELESLFELERRGKANGVEVYLISEKELSEIEPNAKTHRYALFSPTTATVNPVEVNQCIKRELQSKGVTIYFNEPFIKRLDDASIRTAHHVFKSSKIINAAGLYADKVAGSFGFSKDYTIIPFKGIYLKYKGADKPITTNIYPVPNLKNPFLGVHYTVTVDNTIKIGPTAIPAFWRENYVGMSNFKIPELFNILTWEAILFLTNSFGFRSLAMEEVRKYSKKYFTGLATNMVTTIDDKLFTEWSKPGIRAQLLNKKSKKLVMDFVVEGNEHSVHILNAVSPAFTGSMPFAKWIVDNYINFK